MIRSCCMHMPLPQPSRSNTTWHFSALVHLGHSSHTLWLEHLNSGLAK